MLSFGRLLTRHSKTCSVLPVLRLNNFSSSVTPELKKVNSSPMENENDVIPNNLSKPVPYPKSHSPMVAAAFASLNSQSKDDIKTPILDDKLKSAKTVEGVLSLSEGNGISRRHALRVVSILADWCMEGKIQLADFETDPRFINLCKVLTKGVSYHSTKSIKHSAASRSEDLTTVLSVTADDEAAKLVSSITLAQMVKVMSTLSMKKRRSTLLLRTLSFNITKSTEQLNLKQCGDLLYSMSTLNFSDENLFSRITNDICTNLDKNFKVSSVVGSIITSVGLLKYKNPVLLDCLSEWIMTNHSECRPQDIYSLLMTLAILNYTPTNSEILFGTLIPQLNQLEAGKPLIWLEIVWSLVLLNKATNEHVAGVLNSSFLKYFEGNTSVSTRLKLLNIDGAAQYLLNGYEGPRISSSSVIRDVQINQNKNKAEMVDSIVDGLKSLIQSDRYLRTRINTGHGFYIDAECAFDKKFNPVPLSTVNEDSEATRIAILAQEYHDMCLGKVGPTGINVLSASIIQAQGYKLMTIPYTDFRPRDKLVSRVRYIEAKLKELINNS